MNFDGNSKYVGTIVNDCEVIGYNNPSHKFLLRCCKCGKIFQRSYSTVLLEKSRCECSKKRKARHTDGYANTKIKSVYLNMLDRCFNENCHAYKDYGGRGITVTDTWCNDFREFNKWAKSNGYKEGLTLDRINNEGNYEPSNCRWVDSKTQCNNRRSNVMIFYDGNEYTIAELSRLLGVNYATLYSQIEKGKYERKRNK